MWSSEPRDGLAICRAKALLSFLSHFKTLSVVPVLGTETGPPTLQSSALPPELILQQLKKIPIHGNVNFLHGNSVSFLSMPKAPEASCIGNVNNYKKKQLLKGTYSYFCCEMLN